MPGAPTPTCLFCGRRSAGRVCKACLTGAASTVGEGFAKIVGPMIERKINGLLGAFQGAQPGSAPRQDAEVQAALDFFGFDAVPAEKAEVEKRYRNIMKLVHPDHGGDSKLAALAGRHRATLLKTFA